jgi:hypothetical protein
MAYGTFSGTVRGVVAFDAPLAVDVAHRLAPFAHAFALERFVARADEDTAVTATFTRFALRLDTTTACIVGAACWRLSSGSRRARLTDFICGQPRLAARSSRAGCPSRLGSARLTFGDSSRRTGDRRPTRARFFVGLRRKRPRRPASGTIRDAGAQEANRPASNRSSHCGGGYHTPIRRSSAEARPPMKRIPGPPHASRPPPRWPATARAWREGRHRRVGGEANPPSRSYGESWAARPSRPGPSRADRRRQLMTASALPG